MPIDLRQQNNHQEKINTTENKLHQYYEKQNQTAEEPVNKNKDKIIHQWQAPEFEIYERSQNWYFVFLFFIIMMIIYALYTDGPIMAITFILLGIVGFIHLQRDPRIINFAITKNGIIADKELYLFENIESFWIFYDPPHSKSISIKTKASMLPYLHIPLENEDPVHIRELLISNISEIKQNPSFINTIEKVFHL